MESEENVGLSDIIDILNTLDSPLDQNGAVAIDTASPLEGQQMSSAVQQQQPPQPQQQMPQASQPKSKSPQARLRHSQSASEPGTDYSNVYVNTSATPSTSNNINNNNNTSTSGGGGHRHKPYIKILEQPNGKILRFRYKCEGRSAGSIPGVNSTAENKTFPTIEIMNYTGEVVVVVSCVTKDPPYRPHPHNLVGKEGCKDGVCTLTLSGEPLRAVFSNLGIQCVKKRDIKEALDKRESIKVDPFKTKFGHKDQPSSIDLNAVRLCFQAFLKTPDAVKPLTPVVSDPIYDKKAMCNLMICRLCSCSAKVGGGDEIILLCEKITKNDIKVKFFEVNAEGQRVWEDFAEFQQTDIHRQTAIAFKTPRYHSVDITEKARVFIQLLRPSDGMTSEPLPFEYYPDPDQIRRKRIKTGGNPMNILRRELQRHEQMQNSNLPNDFKDISASNANFWNSPFPPAIKTEPTPTSPDRFGSHRSPYIASPSPQPLSPLNRIETPSPGLMKAMSAGSQAQMCEMFSFNTLRDLKSPSVFMQQQQQPQQQQQLQQQSSLEQQQAQFVNGNPFISNCNNNIVNNNNNNNNACDENKFVPVSTPNGSSNGLNPFIDHYTLAPHTSGGSITPIWTTQDQTPNLPHFDQFNIPAQQQQQEMLQLPNDIDMLTNGAPSEEVLTLSGLLDLVDNVQ